MEEDEAEEIVRLHTAAGIGSQLEEQFDLGTFQNVLIVCKFGEKIQLNPLLIHLLFPWLESKIILGLHDVLLLPDQDMGELKNTLKILLSSFESERRIQTTVKEETEYFQVLDNIEADLSTFNSDCEDQIEENLQTAESTLKHQKPNGSEDLTVGQFFKPLKGDSVICKECGIRMVGKTSKSRNLLDHLRAKHPHLYEQCQDLKSEKKNQDFEDFAGNEGKMKNMEKRSYAWKFYSVISSEKACCSDCSANISTKLGSTKGLITHIKAYHPDLYNEFVDHKQTSRKKQNISDNREPSLPVSSSDRKNSPLKQSKSESSQHQCPACKQVVEDQFKMCPRNTCKERFHAGCLPAGDESCPNCIYRNKSKYRLCTECGKSVQNMSKHLNIHRGIKPDRLQCHICEKTLCTANALKVHVDTVHEGIRRFKCKFCENMFIYASHLKQHILVVHHNYKNPKAICSDCGKQFKFISTMKRHRRVAHLGEVVPKKHSCSQCKEVFFKESLLTGHLRDQHGIISIRKKPVRSRDSLVDKSAILAEYPNLVKPTDLDFQRDVIS